MGPSPGLMAAAVIVLLAGALAAVKAAFDPPRPSIALRPPALVAGDRGIVVAEVGLERVRWRLGGEPTGDVCGQARQIDLVANLQCKRTCLESGDLQQVIDQRVQIIGFFLNDRQRFIQN